MHYTMEEIWQQGNLMQEDTRMLNMGQLWNHGTLCGSLDAIAGEDYNPISDLR